MTVPYIDIHTHQTPHEGVLAVGVWLLGHGDPPPCKPYAAGIHPWDAGTAREAWMSAGSDPSTDRPRHRGTGDYEGAQGKCQIGNGEQPETGGTWQDAPGEMPGTSVFAHAAAVGEIGLDYARDADREAQKHWFGRQLAIAREMDLPVIIHCVRAYNDTVAMLEATDVKRVIFHGFTGSVELAGQLARRGYYLSFGERSLASVRTIAAMKAIGLERLFLETDTADVTIEQVYARTAEALAVGTDELKEAIYRNYKTIFGTWDIGWSGRSCCSGRKS